MKKKYIHARFLELYINLTRLTKYYTIEISNTFEKINIIINFGFF